MDSTEKMKNQQNESENKVYQAQLNKFLNNLMSTHEVINVCSTPNILKIIGSNAKKIVLSQSDLKNAMSLSGNSEKTSRKHTEGHNIDISELKKLPDCLRNPIMVLKGKADSVIILTDMKDRDNHFVFVPLALDRQKGKVSNISTLYGKKNLENYLATHLSDILAINIKKANLTANIGDQYSKSISGSVVCFDDSIAYTTANVNYPKENTMKENRTMADLKEQMEYEAQSKVIMDMDALGYEPVERDEMFLFWKPKNDAGHENAFGFDGWDAVKDFVQDVHTLMKEYTVKELQDRANGDYSKIEYGTFSDREVQTALNNSGAHIHDLESERSLESGEQRQIIDEKPAPEETDGTLTPKDQLKQRLESGIRQVMDSDQFKNWLRTGGKLYYNNYSFRNAMLVWLQKPDASYVMGYEKWKEFGRNVVQGAQGAKIFIPVMASEKYKGSLYGIIKNNLNSQLSNDPSLTDASYRLGTSNLEFSMNRANHLVGLKVNGVEQRIFASDEEARRFIDRAIIGKVPTGYNVGTVFDAKDVIIPEYLWVKNGYTKNEIAPDEKGNPVKNRRGEIRIFNTPERQARFQTELDTRIAAKDPVKMQVLFDACVAASARKGVPVSLADPENDSTLNGGAKGYYSRATGAIVVDKNLEITERCAVLFHEMGHADLHKNLEALAVSMGEKKISKEMREVQAEAVAYATASTFGIETDTSSFSYLAAYSRGFELQDFQKSLDVIYRETQALTNDIKAELDLMGLNLDLTEKPREMLTKETLESLSTKYMKFEKEQAEKAQAAINELPSLIKQNAANPDIIEVLKYQKENLDGREADLDAILSSVESLNMASTRDEQDKALSVIDAAVERVNRSTVAFKELIERYALLTRENEQGSLKKDFIRDPQKTLDAMKKDFPQLAKLSDPQLQYIAESKFVSRQFSGLLQEHPDEFARKAAERATLLHKAASKNGTFVEINFCEQWTDTPFFQNGTLCSPKIADNTVAGCEAQARALSYEAEKKGEYFPYTKCDITVFTPGKEGNLLSLNTRLDIGDSEQASLKDHLEQVCWHGSDSDKEVLSKFSDSLSERADKRKLIVPDLAEDPPANESPGEEKKDKNLTGTEWGEQIKSKKDNDSQEHNEKTTQNVKDKEKRDRAD